MLRSVPGTPPRGSVHLHEVTVTVPRREQPLLEGITLQIEPGEHVIVFGPSGSGKSSLLRVISGVIPHSVAATMRGSVRVGGVESTDTTVVERSRVVGVLAQDPASALCVAHVDHEVALALENAGVDPAAIDERITRALAVVGAADLRTRDTTSLSGGEAQRVALAATIAVHPAVLLLDEPTSMLDPAGVASVRAAIGNAVAENAPTVVVVEHRLDEFAGAAGVAGLPARAIVLDERGRILADGPTATVLVDHAARLHAAGCWLPLESELLALTGSPGGVENPENARFLAQLGSIPDAPRTRTRHPGTPVLTAVGVAVERGGGTRPRFRWRRPTRAVAADGLILDDIDLSLFRGEIVALLGANGVGKSSLLLALAGLHAPTGGRIDGPRAGLVFQNPETQFLAHRVRDEIAVGLGGDPGQREAVVRRQLAAHRLEHRSEQSPYQLSGGEQRRLSLAAMLAHEDRPVLLADEPTFGLDRRDAFATASAFLDEAATGRSVLFSTHDLRLVATIADRVIVLGRRGTPGGRACPAGPATILADGPTLGVLRTESVLRAAGLELPDLLRHLIATSAPEHDTSVQRALLGLAQAAPAVRA